jgi:hypothetical protein
MFKFSHVIEGHINAEVCHPLCKFWEGNVLCVTEKSIHLFSRILCIMELEYRPVFYSFVILKVKENIPVNAIALCLVIFSVCVCLCRRLCERTHTKDKFLYPEVN